MSETGVITPGDMSLEQRKAEKRIGKEGKVAFNTRERLHYVPCVHAALDFGNWYDKLVRSVGLDMNMDNSCTAERRGDMK
jgi:hypothetical protein